jgi:hypothetical protein
VDGGASARSTTERSGLRTRGCRMDADARRLEQEDYDGDGERGKKTEKDGQHRSPPLYL